MTASTYFGGGFYDGGYAVAIGPDGQVHAAGYRFRDVNYNGDTWAARFNASLSAVTG